MLLRAVIIGRQLLYALDHAYFALILVNRFKETVDLKIVNRREFGPKCSWCDNQLHTNLNCTRMLHDVLTNVWTIPYQSGK